MDATQFQVSDGKTYNLVKPLLDEAAEGSSYTYQVSEQGNNGTIWLSLLEFRRLLPG